MSTQIRNKIVAALSGFRLPEFSQDEVEANWSFVYNLLDPEFHQEYAPLVSRQSGQAISLVPDPNPRRRIKGLAVYFKLQRGSEVLPFGIGQGIPLFFRTDQ